MRETYTVLIVEDGPGRERMEESLATAGHRPEVLSDSREALQRVRKGGVNLVVLGVDIVGGDARALVEQIRAHNPQIPILVFVRDDDLELPVELLLSGAEDILPTPVDLEELRARVDLALERLDLRREVRELRRLTGEARSSRLVGNSASMRALAERLPSLAASDATVLIRGQTGTGKEVVARVLHEMSPRSDGPFVALNCGALPAALLESELFGAARGAYTGAGEQRTGLVEAASGGTLLLDEIGEVPTTLQAKLLRLLQQREFRPVGANRVRISDARIIAATNRDLEAAVAEGSFRSDLRYRLDVLPITIPPLCDRLDDVPDLVQHFTARLAPELDSPVCSFSPEALQKLQLYSWPGNVRELENKVHQIVAVVANEVVEADDFELPVSCDFQTADGLQPFREAKREAVATFEIAYVNDALGRTNGNISAAARLAGKHPRAFWELVRTHDIQTDTRRTGKPE